MPLTANFLADFSSFLKACADATTSTDELVESAGKVGQAMDQAVGQAATSLKNVGTSVAEFGKNAWSVLNSSQLRQFAGDVSSFVSGYINEFAQAESANVRLEQSLKNAGLVVPEIAKLYDDMAKQIQESSRFSSSEVKEAMALFTTLGKVAPEAMLTTLQATANLAAYMQTDFVTAASFMMKAAASNGEALGKMRTILGDSYTPGMNFAQMMEAINQKFGGQALADLQTTSGAMASLKNEMSDINEQVGKVFAETLKTIFDWFNVLPEGIQKFAIGAAAIGTALAPVLVSLAAFMSLLGSTGLLGILATAAEAVATFVAGLLGWPALIIAGIAALAIGIYHYWDEIVAFLGKAVDKIKYFLTTALPNAFTSSIDTVAKWYAAVKYWLQDQFTKIIDWVIAGVGKIADAFNWLYNQVVGFSSVPDMIDGIAREFGRLDRVMIGPALDAVDEVNAAFSRGIDPMNLTAGAAGAAGVGAGGAAGAGVTVTVNMTGMLGTDDPQTRALMSDLVSSAVMQGMRGGRLLGTA